MYIDPKVRIASRVISFVLYLSLLQMNNNCASKLLNGVLAVTDLKRQVQSSQVMGHCFTNTESILTFIKANLLFGPNKA